MKLGIPVIVETPLPTHIPLQALVFAGGIGSRMENKDGLPKHMLPIDVAGCKRPLIASILDQITVRIDQIVVGVRYRASQVERYLQRTRPNIRPMRLPALDDVGSNLMYWSYPI